MSEEIDNIFQGEKMRPITKDNFYSLNYRKAIVKEVTRVISIVHSFVRSYKGNLKNVNDMHLCKVRVILGWQLSWTTPLKITIQGSHVHNFPINNHEVTRKILAPLNGASEEKIGEALNNQQNLCSKNPNESENSPAKYYQLTVSDEMEEILSEGLYTSTLDDVMSMNKHGESYLDYTWNGSFRDVCKHVHAVLTYFKDKQRVLPSSNKNLLIYNGSVAYQEIIRLYNLQGNLIFNSNERPTNHINEPFRPNDQILVH
ncbi:hypothetical protein RhiirC2_844278 [Rhizophagus irregularis]|uniref:Uncharacterized protein n=1 Tax=Rhizophagus irregularis TaxID=588596 RepID=A0A2N1NUN0_9GLOM|nr:hypothetical protein RhiirC2_847163 [Rhizophagus irregularis]PKK77501.1 hypothetical protein RhiirC2_844278 [Rhizophagus irregularis]